MKLNEREEIVGTLVDINAENRNLILTFGISKRLELPASAIPKEKLQALVGTRIGLLHLDGKEYRIRTVRQR